MNLPKLLTGCIRAIRGAPDWEIYFSFSRQSFYASFLAIILALPFYGLCAHMVLRERAANLGDAGGAVNLPLGALILLAVLYALMFVLVTYIISLVFDRQIVFKSWVIVRQWSMFFMAFLAGLIAGANLLGILPFSIAIYALLALYLATLAVDIILAHNIGGFDWGPAVLTGCLITAMSLMILLLGVMQYI